MFSACLAAVPWTRDGFICSWIGSYPREGLTKRGEARRRQEFTPHQQALRHPVYLGRLDACPWQAVGKYPTVSPSQSEPCSKVVRSIRVISAFPLYCAKPGFERGNTRCREGKDCSQDGVASRLCRRAERGDFGDLWKFQKGSPSEK